MKYNVALIENDFGCLEAVYYFTGRDNLINSKSRVMKFYGHCKPLFFLSTNDRASYLSALIKCEILALKNMVSDQTDMLIKNKDSQYLYDMFDSYKEEQSNAMYRIGRLVSRLF